MPLHNLSRTSLLGLALCLASPALGSPVGDALDELGTAIDAAKEEGGRCQRAVVGDLRDVVDELEGLKRGKNAPRKLVRTLEKLVEAAEDECPRGVKKALSKALEALEDGKADEDEDEDDDRGGKAKKRKKAAPCWNDNDPGCGGTRGGHPPMSRAAFDSLMTAVRGAKPHVFPMQDVVKSMMGNQYLTSMQLGILVEEFKPHVFPMQDVVKVCAPKLVDPQNGGVVSAKFQPHVFPMQDVARLISAQSAD